MNLNIFNTLNTSDTLDISEKTLSTTILAKILCSAIALFNIIPEQVEAKGRIEAKGKDFYITGYTCSSSTPKKQRYMNCSSLWTKQGNKKKGGNSKTATGTTPTANRTAACPSTKKNKKIFLRITYEDGATRNITRTCEDTGGAINGNRVDIYVDTYEEALKMTLKVGKKDPLNNKKIKKIEGYYYG